MCNVNILLKKLIEPAVMARPSSLSTYLFTIVIFLVVILISTTCEADESKLPKKKNAANLFIFGDSILDAGNNNYINTTTLDQANFWPYGETFFKYPTGRFSDGRLVSDFISEIFIFCKSFCFIFICWLYKSIFWPTN